MQIDKAPLLFHNKSQSVARNLPMRALAFFCATTAHPNEIVRRTPLMRMKEGKLVLIGAGMVGSATLNAILAQSVVSEIVVIDANEDKALGEVLDALHTTSFAYSTNTTIRVGSYADCADASIIVMTAGPSIQAGDNDRRVLAEKNIAVMDAVMAEITRYTRSAILIVVTNPVDLVTYFAQTKYNYPADKIFGTGTLLDTARMRQLIAAQCDVDSKNVHGYLLGEHGESAFIPWSMVNVAGIPVDELPRAFGLSAALDKEKILADTKASGLRVLKLKGFTSSGIAQSVARLVRAIVLNERCVLPVSCVLQGEYDLEQVAMSVPCVIGANGRERVLEVTLLPEEQDQLAACCESLQKMLLQLGL